MSLLAVACGGRARLASPPALFPLATAWTTPLEAAVEPPLASDGRRLYVPLRGGGMATVRAADGRRGWRASGAPASVTADEGVVILRARDGTVRALEIDGRPRWETPSGVSGELPPVLDGERLVIAGAGLAVLETATGRVVWSLPGPEVKAPPAVGAGCVLVSEGDGTLRCRDLATGSSRWTYSARGPARAAAIVSAGGRVLVGAARELLSLDARDGHRRWRWKVGAEVPAPAATVGKVALFVTHESVLHALREGGGNLVWRASLPSRPRSRPLVVGTSVLVACYGTRPSENVLVGFDARNGERLGDLRTPAELSGEPLLAAGRLFLPLTDAVVALELPPPGPSIP
jgi:outer membrane protein assembly factor BamB